MRNVLTCDISLGSLTLPASEAGDFVELIPLYKALVLVVFNECCRVLKSTANLVLQFTREGMCIRLVRNFRDVTEKEGGAFIYGTTAPIHKKRK
jgi:hypothetical protein